jgi:hypothetical protein
MSQRKPTLKCGLQQASLLDQIRRKMRLPRFCLGSFSKAGAVFDPDLKLRRRIQTITMPTSIGTDPSFLSSLAGLGSFLGFFPSTKVPG